MLDNNNSGALLDGPDGGALMWSVGEKHIYCTGRDGSGEILYVTPSGPSLGRGPSFGSKWVYCQTAIISVCNQEGEMCGLPAQET